jgi:hypothetical protein
MQVLAGLLLGFTLVRRFTGPKKSALSSLSL